MVKDAQIVVPCRDLDANIEFYTKILGFRIDRISPADSPREVDIQGHGLALLLRRSDEEHPGILRLPVERAALGFASDEDVTAPNGTMVEFAPWSDALDVPPVRQSMVISRIADSADFSTGRAGMGYRDLIPGRQGGRFIASHIRIAEGGDVPDYAHFHKIRFQMIFCYKGWARLVYEDQGEAFILAAGDCVVQPPEIRHRVLQSSKGMEVIEIGCPAEHDTYADHDINLPTGVVAPDRDFGGQRFVHHVAADASWTPWRFSGWECRDLEIGTATNGLAGARVARWQESRPARLASHEGEFVFEFVLDGEVNMTVGNFQETLTAGDSIVIPAGRQYGVTASGPASILEVSLPAEVA